MKIILSGSIAVDRILHFSGHFKDQIKPEKLDVLSVSILLDQLLDTRGGIAANIAYGLALLGEKPVLYGSVGQNSRSYMEDLAKLGVETNYVHYSTVPTASFTVMTDQADCQIGGFFPGAMSDAQSLDFHEFGESKLAESVDHENENFIVISPHDPAQMARQVSICTEQKLRLFYDVGQQATNISGTDIQAGIEAAELLIVNEYEMAVLVEKTGWTQAQILEKVTVCVVTLGEKGSYLYQGLNKEQTAIPALKVTQVVDPTGAGDAFRAGFLYGYARDLELQTCVQLGSTLAASAIEHQGTQTYTVALEQLLARCRQSYDTFTL